MPCETPARLRRICCCGGRSSCCCIAVGRERGCCRARPDADPAHGRGRLEDHGRVDAVSRRGRKASSVQRERSVRPDFRVFWQALTEGVRDPACGRSLSSRSEVPSRRSAPGCDWPNGYELRSVRLPAVSGNLQDRWRGDPLSGRHAQTQHARHDLEAGRRRSRLLPVELDRERLFGVDRDHSSAERLEARMGEMLPAIRLR